MIEVRKARQKSENVVGDGDWTLEVAARGVDGH